MNKETENQIVVAVDKDTWEDEWERQYVIGSALKGARVMEKLLLERASKWLKENYSKYCAYNVSHCGLEFKENELVKDFLDAIEGNEKPKCDFVFIDAAKEQPKHGQRCICYDKYLRAYACYIYDHEHCTWRDQSNTQSVCRYDEYRVTEWTQAN